MKHKIQEGTRRQVVENIEGPWSMFYTPTNIEHHTNNSKHPYSQDNNRQRQQPHIDLNFITAVLLLLLMLGSC